MVIGLKRGTIELHDHDPDWESLAAETIRLLWDIFGEVAVDIQHVGSTAIRSIQAKPILDIAGAVAGICFAYHLNIKSTCFGSVSLIWA